MVKTKSELIGMCDNNHDRKVMQEALNKHDAVMRRAYNFMFLGGGLFILGIVLIKLVETSNLPEWTAFISIASFGIGFFCIMYSASFPIRNAGLI